MKIQPTDIYTKYLVYEQRVIFFYSVSTMKQQNEHQLK